MLARGPVLELEVRVSDVLQAMMNEVRYRTKKCIQSLKDCMCMCVVKALWLKVDRQNGSHGEQTWHMAIGSKCILSRATKPCS
jgi:hypothetical protein